jgi:hypothetical protein
MAVAAQACTTMELTRQRNTCLPKAQGSLQRDRSTKACRAERRGQPAHQEALSTGVEAASRSLNVCANVRCRTYDDGSADYACVVQPQLRFFPLALAGATLFVLLSAASVIPAGACFFLVPEDAGCSVAFTALLWLGTTFAGGLLAEGGFSWWQDCKAADADRGSRASDSLGLTSHVSRSGVTLMARAHRGSMLPRTVPAPSLAHALLPPNRAPQLMPTMARSAALPAPVYAHFLWTKRSKFFWRPPSQ